MRPDDIIASVLSFLGLSTLIGTHVLVSCLLALGIVGLYGAALRLIARTHAVRNLIATLASVTLASLAIAIATGLVYFWGAALGRTFAESLTVWGVVMASGASWALAARAIEARQADTNALRGILS